MRFVMKPSSCSARIGIIDNISRLPQLQLETPLVFLYTKAGSVPHLSKDIWEMITKESYGMHIPLTTMSNIENRLTGFNGTIAEFIGNKNFLMYFTTIDPDETRLSGYDNDRVSLWTRNGKAKYDVKSYLNLIEQLKPDMFAVLSDGASSKWNNSKKISALLNNYTNLTTKCLEAYEHSEHLKKSEIVVPLEGGLNVEARENCSKVVKDSSVFGVVIDGLDNYGEKIAEINIEDVKPLIEASLKHISNDKLRIIHGCWNPKTVLHLIEMGIDVLDTSYPYIVSKQGGALNFINNQKLFHSESDINHRNHCDTVSNSEVTEPEPKKIKLENSNNESQYFISLKDSKYSTSFEAISSTCTCLTCRKYTKAYIHHLLNVNELSASMLLMIHNMHHYLEFFSTIRTSLKSNDFVEMVKNFDDLYR